MAREDFPGVGSAAYGAGMGVGVDEGEAEGGLGKLMLDLGREDSWEPTCEFSSWTKK